VRNLFLSGTFIIQEPFFHRSFILLGMSFIQEPFSGNLSVSGAFFKGTLFSGTFRRGGNFLAGTLRSIPIFYISTDPKTTEKRKRHSSYHDFKTYGPYSILE
jgi:hypothetical protein